MRYMMKQKLFCWGDDFTIKDDAGTDRFFVDGKAFNYLHPGKRMTLKEIVKKAKSCAPEGIKVEVEVTNLKEVREAVAAAADIIMFDNMGLAKMRAAVKIVPAGIMTEASGNINLKTVRAAAETGVNFISVGALTHSSKALDISLEFQPIIKNKK